MSMLSQIPTLPSGALETWLLAAFAAGSMALVFRKLLPRKPGAETDFVPRAEFRQAQERTQRDIEALRDRLDARFLALSEKLDALKTELLEAGERRGSSLHQRLAELEAGLARVDERTKR